MSVEANAPGSETGAAGGTGPGAGARENIVLIGMPGAGKSTLGVVVAKILAYDFLDADLAIQNRFGAPLHQLIDEHGVEGFIALEGQVLEGLDVHRTVIATGGSAVYSEDAMRTLRNRGTVVYLQASLAEIEGRLGSLQERGVVMRGEGTRTLAALYAQRVPLYERWADLTLSVEGASVRECALQLAALLGK